MMRIVACAGVLLCSIPVQAHAQGTLTQDEALRLAFPPPLSVERRTAYFDEAQLARASELAGAAVSQSVITYYVASNRGSVAYFDNHRVRTHGEVLMIVVDREDRIVRIEVLRFAEPPEYRAPDRWLALFAGRALTPSLSLKRDIPNMTGATLTAQAVTSASRRVLALHAVIQPFRAP